MRYLTIIFLLFTSLAVAQSSCIVWIFDNSMISDGFYEVHNTEPNKPDLYYEWVTVTVNDEEINIGMFAVDFDPNQPSIIIQTPWPEAKAGYQVPSLIVEPNVLGGQNYRDGFPEIENGWLYAYRGFDMRVFFMYWLDFELAFDFQRDGVVDMADYSCTTIFLGE